MSESKEIYAVSLIHILEGKHDHPEAKLNSLVSLASENKVLLQLLRSLGVQSPLRDAQERAQGRVVHVVDLVSRALRGYDYAFFKLLKPMSYVPADIDLLIRSKEITVVSKKVVHLGYKVVVNEPHCITLARGTSIVDLYTHPTFGGIIYLDGQVLLEHVRSSEFNGIGITTLESYAEALVTATHAVYKELIYTLNDYFTVNRWASRKSFELAEELNCKPALAFAVNLNQMIGEGLLGAPYKLPLAEWVKLMLRKLRSDPLARRTSVNMLKTMKDPRIGKLMLSRLSRRTY